MSASVTSLGDYLDFSKYAPQFDAVNENDQTADMTPPSGELGQLGKLILTCFALAWRCFIVMAIVIYRRLWTWFETRIVHSLLSAWIIAGIGWGGFVSAATLSIVVLAR